MIVEEKNVKESVRDYVTRVLKKNIIECEIKPGEILSENKLAEMFHVSKTPLRESFVELSYLGLVTVVPQKGSVVTKISLSAVDDARFARRLIERGIVELCCEIEKRDFLKLDENILLEELYLQNGYQNQILKLDISFHEGLFQLANRSSIYRSVLDIRIPFERLRRLVLDDLENEQTVAAHQGILQAIKDRDRDRAVDLMDRHLVRYQIDSEKLMKRFPDYITE